MKVIRFNTVFACVLLFVFFLTGCVGINNSRNAEAKPSEAETPKAEEPIAVYYDFEDVLVPKELSIINNKTMVISTPEFASGVLTLQGRVEKNSLFTFFMNNMMKDNWVIESSIKSPGVTILVFKKATRCAVITFQDSQFNSTSVQIGVAPIISSN
ncbi:MAG: hypothetical protein GY707_13450 [Desulfobacteraceae bacterium]|nr:hypothetical protein [Desulfobacteraceae bacterium]